MAKNSLGIEKFGPQDKSKIRGKVGHTRTGACTSKGKCQHGTVHSKRRKERTR